MFGFDFQVNAAIVLMLENIEELNSLRIEGICEDIEIELNNGTYILAQAKAIERSSHDFNNVRRNLQKSLCSLSDGAQKCEVSQLIFITNSPNPLNEEISRNLFSGTAHREYKSLPPSSKERIDNYLETIQNPLNTDKFMIQILPFETDNDLERYKVVRQSVDDFIGMLNVNIPGLGKKILEMWQNNVFQNGSKKEEEIKFSKRDLIWPIILIATDIERMDDKFIDIFDASLYDEIIFKYKDLIDCCCERCEFFIKVLCDYQLFESSKSTSEKCIDFTLNRWMDYKSEFEMLNADLETQKGVIQIILYSIVRNRLVIERIKKGVNL